MCEWEGDDGSGEVAPASSSNTSTSTSAVAAGGAGDVWARLWSPESRRRHQLVLVVHDEASSAKLNAVEVEIVRRLLGASSTAGGGGRGPGGEVAVVSPHRAQCAALRAALLTTPTPDDGGGGGGGVPIPASASAAKRPSSSAPPPPLLRVDTVERLQGAEAPVVVFSATASSPSALSANAAFYSSLHRANVAMSRARERLVVVASAAMLSFVPQGGGAARYRDLALWKELRAACRAPIGVDSVDGVAVRVFGCC